MRTATKPASIAAPGSPPRTRLGGVTLGLGHGAQRLALALVLGALSAAVASAQPVVSTNQPEYSPGDTVMVTGSGWLAHEAVTLTFFENPIHHEPRGFMAITDSSGSIRNGEYVIAGQERSSLCTVFAYGEASGLLATATIKCRGQGTIVAAAAHRPTSMPSPRPPARSQARR